VGRATSNAAAAALALACAAAPPAARAQDGGAAPQSVTVTATRIAAPTFDIGAAVDRVDVGAADADKPGVNLSEVLGEVPGVLARDRQNYAQDLQLSIRGFGARSSFGIRGIRLYVDGIPATMPDGQGQLSHVDLGSAAAIEVLRGPFSALYGNASGGVVQVFTRTGQGPPTLDVGAAAGSDGQRRERMRLAGAEGAFDYDLAASHFQTRGWREHGAARRDLQNAKLGWRLDADTRVTVIGNAVDLPEAQDPLGLSRAGMAADPRGVDPSALAYDTRKSLRQSQGGLVLDRRLGADDDLHALVYGGQRRTTQFQAIPVGAQANPASPGGVIALARGYGGAAVRWTHRGELLGAPAALVAGLDVDRLLEHRQGLLNYVGASDDPVRGVAGALRRDGMNLVTAVDPYAQLQWHPGARWTLEAGVRRSRVRFSAHDRLAAPGTADTRITDEATLPALSVLYAVDANTHVYASAGRSFETPTLNELAYRPDGQPGLNTGLRPAHGEAAEIGVKLRRAALGELALALFGIRTHDELATLSSGGGRSTYRNAVATRRQGVELAWARGFGHDLAAQANATWLDARYLGAFLACAGTPCPAPTVPVASGSRLPGVARATAYARLDWAPPAGWHAGVEVRAVGRVEVDDANDDSASPCTTVAASAGWRRRAGRWTLDGFVRVDNLAARRCVGSVIVDEGSGRYFEPAPGRTVFSGIDVGYRF
jgi:iron complex outermembrane receptor protein